MENLAAHHDFANALWWLFVIVVIVLVVAVVLSFLRRR
jgi:hypothetical protein